MPLVDEAKNTYEKMIKEGIAPEMARMVLPQNMMTEWYWTGSLMAFARVCNLRNKPDSQEETRMLTQQMARHLLDHFPISAKCLLDEKV
jgi:thymidylate synthase (FAD)